MSGLDGKVIAITGASSGIGEATAKHLAERGAAVMLGARRLDVLEGLAAEIGRGGGKAEAMAVDVAKRADLAAFVDRAKDRFGRLDVLVSNAGLMPLSLLDELKVDEWDRMIDVNIRGVLHGIAAALPVFRNAGSGHFVNVSSVSGLEHRTHNRGLLRHQVRSARHLGGPTTRSRQHYPRHDNKPRSRTDRTRRDH